MTGAAAYQSSDEVLIFIQWWSADLHHWTGFQRRCEHSAQQTVDWTSSADVPHQDLQTHERWRAGHEVSISRWNQFCCFMSEATLFGERLLTDRQTDSRFSGLRWANRCGQFADTNKCDLWWPLLLRWVHHGSAHQSLTEGRWHLKTFSIPFRVQQRLLSVWILQECLWPLTFWAELWAEITGTMAKAKRGHFDWFYVFGIKTQTCLCLCEQCLSDALGFQFDGDDPDVKVTCIKDNLFLLIFNLLSILSPWRWRPWRPVGVQTSPWAAESSFINNHILRFFCFLYTINII